MYVAEKYDDEGKIHLRYWATAKQRVAVIDILMPFKILMQNLM